MEATPKISAIYLIDINNDGNYQEVELYDEKKPIPTVDTKV